MLCLTQMMSFLAGYSPTVLHVINTLKNFRSRWEKLASTLLFLHCGLLEACSEAGTGVVLCLVVCLVVWLEWLLTPLLLRRGWCLGVKESHPQWQGGAWNTHPFQHFPLQLYCLEEGMGELDHFVKILIVNLKKEPWHENIMIHSFSQQKSLQFFSQIKTCTSYLSGDLESKWGGT